MPAYDALAMPAMPPATLDAHIAGARSRADFDGNILTQYQQAHIIAASFAAYIRSCTGIGCAAGCRRDEDVVARARHVLAAVLAAHRVKRLGRPGCRRGGVSAPRSMMIPGGSKSALDGFPMKELPHRAEVI